MDRAALPILFSVSFPAVNGITTYSVNLARGLARLGYPTRLLLTEADTLLATYHERPLAIPADVAVERLPVSRIDGWGSHWGALCRVLEQRAPAVYMPNADYRHSVVSPALGPGVSVVGVVHADEPLHYDHVARLGRHWDAVVCVSRELAAHVLESHPELGPRLRVIRNGVETPARFPSQRTFDGPLKLVYHGSFKQQQKRILDFLPLLRAVRERCPGATLTLIGSGPDDAALREAARPLIALGALAIEAPVPNDALRERLREFHVYLLNSEFEGMPQALLEAMSQACVPVVSDVSSGTREVVKDGENGYRVGVSDFAAFAERLAQLDRDRARLERMSRSAFETVGALGLRVDDMALAYDALLMELAEQSARGASPRVRGPVVEPPGRVGGLSVFLTPLLVRHPSHGGFPSWSDATDFEWERSGSPERTARETLPVVVAVRELAGGYQAELGLELARRLRAEGRDARLAFLRPSRPDLAPSTDVPMEVACARRDAGWAGAAARMLGLVESHAPCHYVALDRETACLAPGLSGSVLSVVMAGLEDVGWLHASRLLHYLDGVVFSSPDAEAQALGTGPPAGTSVSMIRLPVQSLAAFPARDAAELRVLVYAGHLDGPAMTPETARALLEALAAGGPPKRVTLAIPRGTLDGMQAALSGLAPAPALFEVTGRPGLRPLLEQSDLVVQPTLLPDVSLVLLEALGHACLPVCVRSPALERTLAGELGAGLVAEPDPLLFAGKVHELGAARARLRELGEAARVSIASHFPTVDDVLERWIRVLRMVRQTKERVPRHVRGPIFPPFPDVSDLAALEQKLVRVPGVGAFNHWHEWIEFETRAGMPHRLAMAVARWARRKARRHPASVPPRE